MALFVIYGKQSSGKTHTCWLIYNLLKYAGKELDFIPKGLTHKPSFSEIIEEIRSHALTSSIIHGTDFRALFDYKGKKVAIMSARDYLGNNIDDSNPYNKESWGYFKNNMHWAKINKVDHIICCSRLYKTSGGVRDYILENYREAVYRWYRKNEMTGADERIKEAQRIAIEVFTDIKANV